MEHLGDLFNDANLLPTVLMALVVMYWLLMIAGVVGMDMFDFDVDVDADVGIDVDSGLDAGADLDVEAGDGGLADAGGADLDTGGGGSTSSGGGFARTIFDFFYLSDVPIVIVASVFMFGYWVASVVFNHFFNVDQTFNQSLFWVIPSTMVALVVTKIAIIPAAIIGRQTAPEDRTRSNMMGVIGIVTTSKITDGFGQMEVKFNDEPEIVLNIRVASGQRLEQGDSAKIISYNNDDGTFLVALAKLENNSDE